MVRYSWPRIGKYFRCDIQLPFFYDGSVRDEMVKNYRKLKTLMVDCKWFQACPMKLFYEEGRVDKKWIELYCKGDWKSCVRYHMEERGKPHPDWMLPDGSLNERLRD